jgi:mannose-6-phosphate isomerase-like protein (cupin superfamily)
MPDVFDAGALLGRLATDRHDFAEFLRAPSGSLSMTIARWPANTIDDQTPHTEDEVYYVIAGRATLVIDGQATSVAPGSLAFVAAGVEHRFRDIAEDLVVLVFWSPARHTTQ